MSCLTCPTDPNLADVALLLQKSALEAEACIFDQEKLLRGAVNQPTVVAQSTNSVVSSLTNFEFPLVSTAFTFTTLFNNASTLDARPAWQRLFLRGGIFFCGITYNVTATTPTDNSLRRTSLGVGPPTFFAYNQSLIITQYETTATNGVDVALAGVFAVDPDTAIGQASLLHTNTSSSVTIAAGMRIWATRLGDSSVIRTVGDA